jgi:outer membrane protein assembly factor BamB
VTSRHHEPSGHPGPPAEQGWGAPQGQQQPWGPGPAWAPPPAGPPKQGKGPLVVIVASSLVLLLAVIAGVAVVRSRGDGNGSGTRGRALWTIPATKFSVASGVERLPTWLSGRTIVRAQQDGVIGYDQATGRRLWGVPLPGEDDTLCASTQQAAGGVVAIGFGPEERCDRVMAVDIGRGRRLWVRERIKREGEIPPNRRDLSLAVTDGVVVAAWSSSVQAYRARGGGRLWRRDGYAGDCLLDQVAGGEALIARFSCGTLSGALAGLDPASGRIRWQWRPQPGRTVGAVLSTAPVVAIERPARSMEELLKGENGLVVLDGNGRRRAGFRVPYAGQPDAAHNDLRNGLVGDQRPPVLTDDTLYLMTTTGEASGVTAIDLSTGERRWTKGPEAGETGGSSPPELKTVAADASGVLAYALGTYAEPSRLLHFSARDGSVTVRKEYPKNVGGSDSLEAVPYFQDGRLFLVEERPRPGGTHGVIALG